MELFMRMQTPLGLLAVAEEDGFITRVSFDVSSLQTAPAGSTPVLCRAVRELGEYFAGVRKTFGVPLRPAGTPFRLKVWNELLKIPYGQTCSYADLARACANPKACRAVGGANHANPIAILIPCHRVVGADGSLTGYGGGLDKKKFLLDLEQRFK